jgi:KaiC/GvpD/RAD55 family RecA-like ATPase
VQPAKNLSTILATLGVPALYLISKINPRAASRRLFVIEPHNAGEDADTSFNDEAKLVAILRPIEISEFLKLELPSRRNILDPWLPERGMAMIFAPRGVGKTLLALSIAYTVASGSKLLGWQSERPRKILYVDGEMPGPELQTRLASIVAGSEREPPAPDYFRLLCADLTEDGLPDLATQEGQRVIDAHIADAELIVLDNISTLCRSGNENEAERWAIVQSWALAHRRRRRSTLFVHHAGKGGLQRGTSKREDVLDTVIALRRPQDYRQNQGARFELHFDKSRGFHGADAKPFEALYQLRDDNALWARKEIVDDMVERVAKGKRDGKSVREIADSVGVSKSRVERCQQKVRDRQMLDE